MTAPYALPSAAGYASAEEKLASAPSLLAKIWALCVGRRKISLSTVFAGQDMGIVEVDDGVWTVSFMQYDLGFFDDKVNRVAPNGQNPFAPIVLPMSSE